MTSNKCARAQFHNPAIELPPALIETARAGQEPSPLVGAPKFVAYIVELSSETNSVELIGWCPHCRFPHRAWLPFSHTERGVDLLRWPGIQCRSRRASRVYHLALSLECPPPELITAAAIPIGDLFTAYRNAKEAEDPPCRGVHFDDYAPDDAVFALRALRKAGVCEPNATALKKYVGSFGPSSPRARIERATRAVLEGARK